MQNLNTQLPHGGRTDPPAEKTGSACGNSKRRRTRTHWCPYEPASSWLRGGKHRPKHPEFISSTNEQKFSDRKAHSADALPDSHQLLSVANTHVMGRPAFQEAKPSTLNLLEKLVTNSHVYFSPDVVLKGVKALQCPVQIHNTTYSEIKFACFDSQRACDEYEDSMNDGILYLLVTVTHENTDCIYIHLQLVGFPKYTVFEQSLRCTNKRLKTRAFDFTFAITSAQEIQPTRNVDSSLQGHGICKHVSHNVLSQLYDILDNPDVELSIKKSVSIGTMKLAYPLYGYCLRGKSLRDVDPDTLSHDDIRHIERKVSDDVRIPVDEYGLCKVPAPHESVPLSKVLSQYRFRVNVIDSAN